MRVVLHTILARIRGFLRPADLERDFDEELEANLALAEEDYVRRGMTHDDARRRARAQLGGLTQIREAGRAARGLPWLGSAWLDLKLGIRLLAKYPGLTIVSTLTLSIGIAIVAGFHAGTDFFVRPSLPVPDGDRVVAIWNHDTIRADRGTQTLGDVVAWRDGLHSVEDVGAFALHERVVAVERGPTQIVRAAEISPVVFGTLRVAPLRGRALVEADRRPAGPPAALIGFDFWQSAYGGDPAVVGRRIRVGGIEHQVVGVMPAGFGFPVNEQLWTALPVPAAGVRPGEGMNVEFAVGRLATGATLERAAAELGVVGARLAADHPQTHARLRPRVMSYASSYLEANEPGLPTLMRAAQWAIGLVLLIVAVNVGTLVYARNAARVGEVALRTALGAGRWRIVFQMFVEALVLAAVAAGIGLAIMAWPVGLLASQFRSADARNGGLPYWFQVGIGADTVLLIVVLVVVAAIVTGVLPALKLTSRGLWSRLPRMQEQSSGLRFGKTATTVVVAQVAISLALLTVGGAQLRSLIREWQTFGEDGLRRDEYLAAELRWDLTPSGSGPAVTRGSAARAGTWRALERRLSREPDVRGVTFSSFDGVRPFEMDGALPTRDLGLRWTYVSSIAPNFFDVFDRPVLAGRAFGPTDLAADRPQVAIVNEEFLHRMQWSGQAVGQYVRSIDPRSVRPAGQALEIVGVVSDFLQFDITHQGPGWRPFPAVYVPLTESATGLRLTVHAAGEPTRLVGRLRGIAAELDPTLVIHRPETLAERDAGSSVLLLLYAYGVGVFVFAVLLLSTAGTYSMMSFTVAQRTREIGIRTALGASPRQVVAGIFSRSALQLGAGAALGLGIGLLASNVFAASPALKQGPGLPLSLAGLLVVMGLIACGRPMRRALRIQPTDALRDGT